MAIQIVLHEPEIPANTGNIGRTCVATGGGLHLIDPLGFSLSEKAIKRAGMDYWQHLDLHRHVNYAAFREYFAQYREQLEAETKVETDERKNLAVPKVWFATTKAHKVYTDVTFGPNDFIMFGKESAGIPEEILVDHEDSCIRIPMGHDIRSLNLSNSVAIVLYEALRQNAFLDLEGEGHLHRLHWHDEAGKRND